MFRIFRVKSSLWCLTSQVFVWKFEIITCLFNSCHIHIRTRGSIFVAILFNYSIYYYDLMHCWFCIISFKVIDCCWPLAVVFFFWFWINSTITFGFFIIWRFTRSLWMYKCTDWSTEYHVRKGYGYRNWRWCDYIMCNLQLKAILICENSVRVRIIRTANFQKWLGRMGKILCKMKKANIQKYLKL